MPRYRYDFVLGRSYAAWVSSGSHTDHSIYWGGGGVPAKVFVGGNNFVHSVTKQRIEVFGREQKFKQKKIVGAS